MGVKGLCSLLEDNRQIYQDIHFSDSKLLVDGTNLVYILYDKSNLDQNHGGEYLAFQVQVQALFTTLADCRIIPHVVMDGGLGTSDIKLNTRMDRQRALLQKIPDALKGRKKGIFPPSIMSVFEQTLKDLKVSLVRCFGEADCQLAALAREWGCPVLSGDTDFCIYDLPGVLPLDHFRWDSVNENGIPCKLYTKSNFCAYFKIKSHVLPLFASLAGNDYLQIDWKEFIPAGSPKMKFRTSILVGLLSWLEARIDWTIEDILKAVMKLIPKVSQDDQTKVKKMLRESMLEYELPSFPDPLSTEAIVPEWVRASLPGGVLEANIVEFDILLHRRKILRIQVEKSDLPSSNLTSRPIRQVLYGLLLGQGGGEVEEVDRKVLEPVSFTVPPLVQGAAQKLRLDPLSQADLAVRLQVCLETLGVEEETLEGVPAHLRLPVAVTRYWLRRASPKPDLTHLKALLMVMVQGELKRESGATGWLGDTNHLSEPLDGVVAHSFNQWQACLKDASKLNLLLCKPLPEPHFAWLYQGRLLHRQIMQLQQREPEDIVQDDQFRRLYRSLLEAVTQPDPGAIRRAGGPEVQLRASMEHLHLNTQEEEEEELGGAGGLDQGSDRE